MTEKQQQYFWIGALLVIMLFAVVFLDACGAKPSPDTLPPSDPAPPGAVAFDDIQIRILDPYCTVCHSDTGSASFLDLTTYGGAMDAVMPGSPDDSSLYTQIRDGDMPKRRPPLSPELVALMETWIKTGANQ